MRAAVVPKSLRFFGSESYQSHYGAFLDCSSLTRITIPDGATVEPYTFRGCTLLQAKSSIYNMTEVEYYRDFYHERINQHVAVLTALKIYQELEEMEPPTQRKRFQLLPGHLNGPRAYRKITAFEMWREIVTFL